MGGELKVEWSSGKEPESLKPVQEKGEKKIDVDRISVGFNNAEMYLKFSEAVIFLTPAAAKRLRDDLENSVTNWETEHGRIKPKRGKKREDSVPKRVLKSLYKSKKVGSKMISINTGKRKHLPMKDK